jgi:hypothetical protein
LLIEELRAALGVGAIRDEAPRRAGWQPLSRLEVRSIKAHVEATIPFFDEYLLPCAKRDQFDAWQMAIEDYIEQHRVNWGMGRSICSVEGCDRVVRGRGLCRTHYYRVTGY